MYLPIRRWRAVVVGVAFGLASQHAAFVSAGIVAPPSAGPSHTSEVAAAQPRLTDAAAPTVSPVNANDAEPFWYPGADSASTINEALSISSIPVQSNDDANLGGLHGMQQHPLIPLPGAAWTGMAGLLGLGAVKLLRNARRLLA
jgi:hypothetical protein